MQFLDEIKIYVRSGDGGSGCVSFLREKFRPRGGPNGGHGGRGGDVRIQAVDNLNTLVDYRFTPHFVAKNGKSGMGAQRHGKNGSDVILRFPVGTQVFEEDGETLIVDLVYSGQEELLLEGGMGGLGNMAFKSSTRQAPYYAQEGKPGVEKWIWLKLKLIADVGIVGMPNAGKSTFLKCVSSTQPKIAHYPFTTLTPQLGVAILSKEYGKSFIIADTPGLIEGAHQGVGLGDKFLKHIERCSLLLCFLDACEKDVTSIYRMLRQELLLYDKDLAQKDFFVALNKTDLLSLEEVEAKRKDLEEVCGQKVYTLSCLSHQGVQELLYAMGQRVESTIRVKNEKEKSRLALLKGERKWHPLLSD